MISLPHHYLSPSSLETPVIADTETKEPAPHPLEDPVPDNPALVHLLTTASLLDRLVTTWTEPQRTPRVSYMGHVTRISNHLVAGLEAVCSSRTLLLQLIARSVLSTQLTFPFS